MRVAAPARTSRLSTPTCSCCGAPTRARRTRSSSTTCCRGCRTAHALYSVDPRRTSTAQWADAWLGLDVGTDIALANAIGREIIHAGLVNEAFVDRATTGFEDYRRRGGAVHAGARRGDHRRPGRADPGAGARLRPRRPGPDLLDAGHHRAPQRGRLRVRADQPGAADRARRALRLRAGAAARAEQRAGRRRHGRHPGQAARRLRPRRRRGPRPLRGGLGRRDPAEARACTCRRCSRRWRRGSCRALYCIGENPAESEANAPTPGTCWRGSTTSSCRTSSGPRRRSMADVVLPAAADWCEYEGTVTNSERRVQRVRKALDPPGQARPDTAHHLRARRPARATTGASPPPSRCGTSCARCR